MAVSGGMTSAYRCQVSDNRLSATPTTFPSGDCANVEAAVERLGRGESVIVAAGDMARLRHTLKNHGIG